ncbi:extracellular solute-binding protein [Pirellulaceae bacterium SH449]
MNDRLQPLRLLLPFVLVYSTVVGCSQKLENEVVIQVDSNRPYHGPILAGFERLIPNDDFQVIKIPFQSEANSDGRDAASEPSLPTPNCDIVWSSDILGMLKLQKLGVLESRSWAISSSWPKHALSSDRTWVGFAARGRVILYNNKLVDPDKAPSSIWELGSQRWSGNCGIASPNSKSSAAHLAIIATNANTIQIDETLGAGFATPTGKLDWDRWLIGVSENARIYADEVQVAAAISAGDIGWGILDSDVAILATDSNADLSIAFPDQGETGFGTVLVPSVIAVIAQAKHPNVAGRLADYLVSPEVEARMTISDGALLPLGPDPKDVSRLLKGVDVRWADVDWESLINVWEDKAQEALGKLKLTRQASP